MNEKSIAIIGAGIAGLSAGCYARMNGYDAHIYEMHNLPGGVCTSWKRKGYTVDGCIGWLLGSSPTSYYYRIYEELGAVQGPHLYQSRRIPARARRQRAGADPLHRPG